MNDEKTWVFQVQSGNDDAFTFLVEKYQNPVYNLCYRMVGEAQAAEDAAQETFLRAYQNILRYDPERSFGTWLLSIAAHYCIDLSRRNKLVFVSYDQDDKHFEFPDPETPDPERETMFVEERERIQVLLKQLNSIDRAAIVLRYWYDFTEAEIAQSLSMSLSAVKSRLHRGRRALGKLWQEKTMQPSVERMSYETPAF
ncbi:MAG: sigma-70 family RNA polymerase sigma factor [Anaerolineales bacterium]|nr:sigma-70 family RNA polymerase sigma factor [Anaerolineales bacterium]